MNEWERLAQRLYHQLPPGFGEQALAGAITDGLLPKSDLVDGELYWGWCRNASQARWDASRQRFVYARTKFGSTFDEDIVHPQDDEGFDVFAVVARVEDAAAPVRGRPASQG